MKKEIKIRHSLNDRINAELASAEEIPLAGITSDQESENSPVQKRSRGEAVATKKATTIMPKELFRILQGYCSDTDTPKHRVICRFILDGLRAAGHIEERDYQRLKEEAGKVTTTYEKHK